MNYWSGVQDELRAHVDGEEPEELLKVSEESKDMTHLADLGVYAGRGLQEFWERVFTEVQPSDVIGRDEKFAHELAEAFAVAAWIAKPTSLGELSDIYAAASGFLSATAAAALARFQRLMHQIALSSARDEMEMRRQMDALIASAAIWDSLLSTGAAAPLSVVKVTKPEMPTWLQGYCSDRTERESTVVQRAYHQIALFEVISVQTRSVYFPVALKNNGESDKGFVLQARIHLLNRVDENLTDGADPIATWANEQFSEWHDCDSVPWSPLTLDQETAKRLKALVSSLPQLNIPNGSKVAYEVWPVERQTLAKSNSLPLDIDATLPQKTAVANLFPETTVEGESLTLGMVLAIWAASHKCELRPLVVSAAVNMNGNMSGVTELVAKSQAVDDWLRVTGRTVELMLVKPDRSEMEKLRQLVGEFQLDPRLRSRVALWNGRKIIEVNDELASLLNPDLRLALLTDGFDSLRDALDGLPLEAPGQKSTEQAPPAVDEPGVYLPEDWTLLEHLVDECEGQFVINENGEQLTSPSKKTESPHDEAMVRRIGNSHIMPLPFGNNPLPAVRLAISTLARRQKAVVTAADQSRTEYPVLIPFLLTTAPQRTQAKWQTSNTKDRISTAEVIRALAERIRQSVQFITGCEISDWETCNQAICNVLNAGIQWKPIFALFSQESCSVNYDQEEVLLTSLSDIHPLADHEYNGSGGRIIVIASDLHHAKFIEAVLTRNLPPTDEQRTTVAVGSTKG